MIQLQEPPRHKQLFQKHFLLPGLLFLLIGGVVIWILNSIGLLPGPWSNVLLIVFTGLSGILPLFQWWCSSRVEIVHKTQSSSFVQQHLPSMQTHLGTSKRKGALIVKVKKVYRGATIHLYRGFDSNDSHPDMASNIILRKIDGSLTCIAIFAAVEPGNCTISVYGAELRTNVTIQAGQVAEIDWQHTQRKRSSDSKRKWGS